MKLPERLPAQLHFARQNIPHKTSACNKRKMATAIKTEKPTTCVDQFRTNEIDNLRKQDTNLPCRETTPNDYETNICTTSFCKAKIAFNIFCVQSFFSKCTIRSQNRRRLTRQNLQRTPLLLKTKRIGKDSNKRCTKIQLQ